MKNFKDFFYDISDLIFAFIILIIVVFLFYTNINVFFIDIFGQNLGESIVDMTTTEEENPKITNQNQADEDIVSTDSEQKNENSVKTYISTKDSVTIDIPKNATSYDIVQILYENNLIKSKEDTMKYITENKIDTKLNSGTFTVQRDMSEEEIIRKITI